MIPLDDQERIAYANGDSKRAELLAVAADAVNGRDEELEAKDEIIKNAQHALERLTLMMGEFAGYINRTVTTMEGFAQRLEDLSSLTVDLEFDADGVETLVGEVNDMIDSIRKEMK